MTRYYKLFDYDSEEWLNIRSQLINIKPQNINDIKFLIIKLGDFSNEENPELKTIDILLAKLYKEDEIVYLFEKLIKYATKLEHLIPEGKIKRLNESNKLVELNRLQILCILCHMTLCTLNKSKETFYWVTFQNWLTDGRNCALVYLQTLIEYFKQSFSIDYLESNEFMNETIVFKRNSSNLNEINSLFEYNSKLKKCYLVLNGSIGDGNSTNSAEIDFANCDIGYGITGTQEEMLFGASPELCVSMLFCDTLKSNEAICITGARKIAVFNGYGLDINVKSFIKLNNYQNWKAREVIAIDAIDFSDDFENSLRNQLETSNLNRELIKAFSGFSFVRNSKISSGFWGCGAFGGNKHLKTLIQLIAASLSDNELIFYCYDDSVFYAELIYFLNELNTRKISNLDLWSLILNIRNDFESIKNQNVFSYLINKMK